MTLYRSIPCMNRRSNTLRVVGLAADAIDERLSDPGAFVSRRVERVVRALEDVVDGELQFKRLQDDLRARQLVPVLDAIHDIAVCGLPERLLGHAREQTTGDLIGIGTVEGWR